MTLETLTVTDVVKRSAPLFDFGIVRADRFLINRWEPPGWRVFFANGAQWMFNPYDGWHVVWGALTP